MSGPSLTLGGVVIGNVDGIASVAAAREALAKDPTSAAAQAAYNSAFANAVAAETALIPGVGGYFASAAITANLLDIKENGSSVSGVMALAGNIVTLFGQGISIVGLGSVPVTGPGGVVLFTVGEVVDAVGFALTAAGASADKNEISDLVKTTLSGLGISQDGNGNYEGKSQSDVSSYSIDSADLQASTIDGKVGPQQAENVDAKGNIIAIYKDGNATITLTSGYIENVVNNAGQSTVSYSGQGGTIDLSNSNITLAAGSQAIVTGNANTVTAGANSSVELASQTVNDIVTMATAGTVVVDDGAQCTVVNASTVSAGNNTGITLEGSSTNVTAGTASTINVANNSNNDSITVGTNSTVSVADSDQGTGISAGDTTISLGNNTSSTINGNSDTLNLDSRSSANVSGGGDTVNAQAGDSVTLSNTNNQIDTVNGSGVTVNLAANVQTNVIGSNNTVSNTGGNDTEGVYGGNNTINTQAGDTVVIGNTNNQIDTINSNGDSYGSGANSWMAAGIYLNADAQTNVIGNNNTVINTGGNDTEGVYGGNNTIDTQAGDTVVIGNTNNQIDTINASGDSYGSGANSWMAAGIYLNANAQTNVIGSNNTVINTGGNDTEGVYGGNNTIDTQAGDTVVIGNTNNQIDTINASGDSYGSGANSWMAAGIYLNASAQTNVVGSNNTVTNTGGNDTEGVYGGNNTINTQAGDTVVIGNTNNQFDTINANGDSSGSGANSWMTAGVYVNGGSQANINGDGNTISNVGDNDTVNIRGNQDTTYSSGNNDSVTNYGLGDDTYSDGSQDVTNNIGSDDTTWNDGQGDITDDDWDDDPIILNLTGGAVETQSVATSIASFDMQNNGQEVRTGWGTMGEGYLVYDPNDASDSTVVTQDRQLVAGFGSLQALAQAVDGTSNGWLNDSDALWGNLKVWVDSTGTGQFQQGQLMSLGQLGITGIDLNAKTVNQNSNGNTILSESQYMLANGKTGTIAGVDLVFNIDASVGAANSVSQLIQAMASFAPESSSSIVATPDLSSTQQTMLVTPH